MDRLQEILHDLGGVRASLSEVPMPLDGPGDESRSELLIAPHIMAEAVELHGELVDKLVLLRALLRSAETVGDVAEGQDVGESR